MFFKDYISQIVKKSVNTVIYHSSKYYFLKFFFERNNKMKNLEIKKNYIFSNSKWTNFYASSLNTSHMFSFNKTIFLSFILIYAFWTSFISTNELFSQIWAAFSDYFIDFFHRLAIGTFSVYSLASYWITGQKFDVKAFLDTLPEEQPEDTKISTLSTIDCSKLSNRNAVDLLLLTRKLFQFTSYPPLNLDGWHYPKTYSTKPIPTLTEVEFENLRRIEDREIFYSSNTAKINSYKLNYLNLKKPDLNNLNMRAIVNLFKEDRWLIKSFIIENNAIFKLNALQSYFNRFNTFFSSNAWIAKKYFFFNQTKSNLYKINTLNLNLLPNLTNKRLFNFTLINLNYSLSDLNFLYLNNNLLEKKNNLETNQNNNLLLTKPVNLNFDLNVLDMFVEENLFFYSKITSNFISKSKILFFPTFYMNPKITKKVTFK